MRIATVLAAIGLMALTTQAHAYPGWSGPEWQPSGLSQSHRYAYSRRAATHHRHYARAHYGRSYGHHGGSLPGPCYLARRQGGPCGCVAEGKIFGRFDHVLNGINHWLANAWLGYPRTSPRPGTAAVWRGHSHVEAVISNNGDGTVTTDGPYGQRRVRIASVVIVDPHGGYVGHREGSRRYARRHYGHHYRRYARAW